MPFTSAPALSLVRDGKNDDDTISNLLPAFMKDCGMPLERSSEDMTLARALTAGNKIETLSAEWRGDALLNSCLSGKFVPGIGKAISTHCGAALVDEAVKRALRVHAESQNGLHTRHNSRSYTSWPVIGIGFPGDMSAAAGRIGEAAKKLIDGRDMGHPAGNSYREDMCENANRIHGTGECLNGGYKRREYVT